MKRILPLRALWSCIVLVCLLSGPSIEAQERFGDVEVQILNEPSDGITHGYSEYKFRLRNLSPTDPHEVRLTLPQYPYTYSSTLQMHRDVLLSPGANVEVEMFQPPLSMEGSGLGISVDGGQRVERMNISIGAFQGLWGHHGRLRLLADPDSWVPDIRSDGNEIQVVRQAAHKWSTNWLAYTNYDGIVVSRAFLDSLPAKVLEAMLLSVQSGGSLVVLGDWKPPAPWRLLTRRLASPVELAEEDRTWDSDTVAETTVAFTKETLPASIDFGESEAVEVVNGVVRSSQPWENAELAAEENVTWYEAGFGVLLVASGARPNLQESPALLGLMENEWVRSAEPWMNRRDLAEANEQFKIVDALTLPRRSLLLLLVLFAILIGPVNFVFLKRRNRRIWLFWTIPVFSALTCGLVVAVDLLGQGWQGRVRLQSVTVLDQEQHRALSLGHLAFYSPLTPSSGLHFSPQTELFSLGLDSSDRSRAILDWSAGQHLAQGWIQARVPLFFKARKNELRRERLVVNQEGGGLKVLNGLGVDVQELFLSDLQGESYHLESLAAGDGSVLGASQRTGRSTAQSLPLREFYGQDWLGQSSRLYSWTADRLPPGTYLARVKMSPFLEIPLDGKVEGESVSWIFGLLEGRP